MRNSKGFFLGGTRTELDFSHPPSGDQSVKYKYLPESNVYIDTHIQSISDIAHHTASKNLMYKYTMLHEN